MTLYFKCTACIGNLVENKIMLSPCLRYITKGTLQNLPKCPKKERGVNIIATPNWETVPKLAFNVLWGIGEGLNAKTNLYFK